MGKTLYLECYSGISGDMTVAALLDLGAREAALREALQALGVGGYAIQIGRTKKCGIDACDFNVVLEDHGHENNRACCEEHIHVDSSAGHEECMQESANTCGAEHIHEEPSACYKEHTHRGNGDHKDHMHEGHTHVHRHYGDIMSILDGAPLKMEVRELARKIFRIVGEAESRVHGCPVEEVHFHETGAVDSIVDIVGAAACAVDLGITETYVSTIYEGQGHVWCQHGRIPVPAPAVAGIAAAEGLELLVTDTKGEMVTPTGAAIAAALRTKRGTPGPFRIVRIGMGAGKKDFPHVNLLRAMIIEEETVGKKPWNRDSEEKETSANRAGSGVYSEESVDAEEDEIWILETNLDDTSGEALGFTMEELMKAGARDVSYVPIYMKKNRPAYRLEVLCSEDAVSRMEQLIFQHTTGIGLRKRREKRRILPRKIATVTTPFGDAKVKVCTMDMETMIYPEYESVRKLALTTGKSYQEIYQRVVEEAWKKKNEF